MDGERGKELPRLKPGDHIVYSPTFLTRPQRRAWCALVRSGWNWRAALVEVQPPRRDR